MNSIRTMVTFGISVFVAATAMAKTVNIRVTLNGSCRTLIHAEALEAILDGDEAAPLHLKQQEDRFHWSYDWDDRRKPAFPDARWSRATLETCIAIIESSRERKELLLKYQVPSPLRPAFQAIAEARA